MLLKPSSCSGCPLEHLGSGFMEPQIAPAMNNYGVTLIGEALGADEAEQGRPFVGKAGFRLTRLIEWAGFERDKFNILNTVWCRPPENKLEGEGYEKNSIAHCRAAHWDRLLSTSKVLVPMGNVPTGAILNRKGILTIRGYVWNDGQRHVIPTVHPAFIARGQAKWSAAFINDLQKAVKIAREGMQFDSTAYLLDPSPLAALRWAEDYRSALRNDPSIRLAFDIETPGKGDEEDEVDLGDDAPDRTWRIDRIGFAYRPFQALSIPWEPQYFAAIRLLLASDGDKVVWNAGFDVPRIRRAGVDIHGTIHDGMVAWHILHSDLPKSLRFVATFTCPFQPAWKHLSGAKPAFYNATDADVELRSMLKIEEELKASDLWDVYTRDVLDLEPLLIHMHDQGMPIDQEIRADRARRLEAAIRSTRAEMEAAIPIEARRIEHVYKSEPADKSGLSSRPGYREVRVCSLCGAERPPKAHFKRFVRKANPCADGGVEIRTVAVTEYYRLADFTPSRDQLIRYHQFLYRPLPMVFDRKERKRKVSFGERQLKDLTITYKDDKLYPSILSYRELDKLAGTYVGRPEEET
jgi:uracil-DNA glycosylase family 4